MNQEEKLLRQACYEVARTTKWDTKPIDTQKINDHCERLFEIAKERATYGQELGITIPLVTRAIIYLNQAHALPPMRDNTEWFSNMLDALLEVACPNSQLEGEARKFLKDLINGISSFITE